MSQIRSDLWCAAFVRRHNDLGHFCVVARKGDPIAGQVFIEIDHLNGKVSLLTPAPALSRSDDGTDRVFVRRLDQTEPEKVRERVEREAEFDPDLWVLNVEMRGGDPGVTIVGGVG
jgi:hypothetical protein